MCRLPAVETPGSSSRSVPGQCACWWDRSSHRMGRGSAHHPGAGKALLRDLGWLKALQTRRRAHERAASNRVTMGAGVRQQPPGPTTQSNGAIDMISPGNANDTARAKADFDNLQLL